MKTVAIQGIKGSFHHIVCQQYYGEELPVKEYMSFDGVVEALMTNECQEGVMALENSIAGSIIPNYALIEKYQLQIVGEHYLDIQHHLIASPGQKISEIKEVHSHPMALLQCKAFLKTTPWIKIVEDKDTALVARHIKSNNLKGVAAIGSQLAAKLYDLEILAERIQTINHNETRFAILNRKQRIRSKETVDKASLSFELDHKRGSLATVLNVMSDCQLNLTKIQSLPKMETPWKYAFFVDVTFDRYEYFKKAKSLLCIMAERFKVFGEYKNQKKGLGQQIDLIRSRSITSRKN